jgi:hypothetical protein
VGYLFGAGLGLAATGGVGEEALEEGEKLMVEGLGGVWEKSAEVILDSEKFRNMFCDHYRKVQ